MKVGDYDIYWEHPVSEEVTLTSRKGNSRTLIGRSSNCIIFNRVKQVVSAQGLYHHLLNNFDRKRGVLESFKSAVEMCPSKEKRKELWDAFWAIRKPTVSVTEETADLVGCVDYMACKTKELIIKDDPLGYNEEWRTFSRPEVVKRLSNRLGMYRDKSDHSLIAIIKLCVIGFINYKRLKDAVQDKSDK